MLKLIHAADRKFELKYILFIYMCSYRKMQLNPT